MVRDKVRIRFQKKGGLRLVSHHDLMRCFERMLRRAELPFRSTSGFHPKPRLVFALSLPLGAVGLNEVVELELDAEVTPEEVGERLARQAPPGLEILSARRIDPRTTAQACGVTYRLPVPPDRAAALSRRLAEALAAPECWVERTRPARKRVNLRPYLRDLRLEGGALLMELGVTPTGTARADDVLRLLDLHDLIDAGAVLERTRLELHDELVGVSGEW
jgi:radical SAM-linked protein